VRKDLLALKVLQDKLEQQALKANKDENKPLANAPAPDPPKKTVAKVKTHVPDVKAVEGRLPFSFAATRKLLYQ
jgi:hypothetical protein